MKTLILILITIIGVASAKAGGHVNYHGTRGYHSHASYYHSGRGAYYHGGHYYHGYGGGYYNDGPYLPLPIPLPFFY